MVRKIRLQRKHFNFIFSTQFQQIAAREGVNYKNEGYQQEKKFQRQDTDWFTCQTSFLELKL